MHCKAATMLGYHLVIDEPLLVTVKTANSYYAHYVGVEDPQVKVFENVKAQIAVVDYVSNGVAMAEIDDPKMRFVIPT